MRNALLLCAILVAALLVRLPGFSWGDDFPGGFRGHHVDEWTHVVLAGTLINPKVPPRWHPQAYPKGLAAHVAIPFLVSRAASGRLFDTRLPSDEALIKTARAVSIAYGVLGVAVLWWIARRLCKDPRSAHIAGLCPRLRPSRSRKATSDSPTPPPFFGRWRRPRCSFSIWRTVAREPSAAQPFPSEWRSASSFRRGFCPP
jgi:hypothetical protein